MLEILLEYFPSHLLFRSFVMETLSKFLVEQDFCCEVIDKFTIALKKSGKTKPEHKDFI